MNRAILRISSVAIMSVLVLTFVASGVPAYAVYGHGSSYGPQFGNTPNYVYKDGLKVNGNPIDISNYMQTIKTQKIYVNDPSDVTLKIYDNAGPQATQHVTLYLNIRGDYPSVYDSNTWIDYDKITGVTIHDPNNIFKSVTASVSYDNTYMYVTFHIVSQTPMKTTHMIVRAWDFRLAHTEVIVKNAIKITYLPFQFSRED